MHFEKHLSSNEVYGLGGLYSIWFDNPDSVASWRIGKWIKEYFVHYSHDFVMPDPLCCHVAFACLHKVHRLTMDISQLNR